MRIFILPLCLVFLCLSACSSWSNPFVDCKRGQPDVSEVSRGVVYGAVGGAAAGLALGSNVASTAAVGGVAGGVMGASLKGAWPAREKVERAGVQVLQEGERLTLYVPADLCFLPASDELKRSAYPVLDQVAVILRTYPCYVPMTVRGNTDDVGGEPEQKRLSDRQARSVAAYLWDKGIPYQQLKIVACAHHEPIAADHNCKGSAQNRRIQINVRPNVCECQSALNAEPCLKH